MALNRQKELKHIMTQCCCFSLHYSSSVQFQSTDKYDSVVKIETKDWKLPLGVRLLFRDNCNKSHRIYWKFKRELLHCFFLLFSFLSFFLSFSKIFRTCSGRMLALRVHFLVDSYIHDALPLPIGCQRDVTTCHASSVQRLVVKGNSETRDVVPRTWNIRV